MGSLIGLFSARTVEVPGLGTLRRGWLSRRWQGVVPGPAGPVRLAVPGDGPRPDPDAVAIAQALLGLDPSPWHTALAAERDAADLPDAPHGPIALQALEVWPYGRAEGGAMAVYEVGWDEEHRWGVWLDAGGGVRGVVVSPGP